MAKASKATAKKVAPKKSAPKQQPDKKEKTIEPSSYLIGHDVSFVFDGQKVSGTVREILTSESGDLLRLRLLTPFIGPLSTWSAGEVRSFRTKYITNLKVVK